MMDHERAYVVFYEQKDGNYLHDFLTPQSTVCLFRIRISNHQSVCSQSKINTINIVERHIFSSEAHNGS